MKPRGPRGLPHAAYRGKPRFLLTYVDDFGPSAEVFTQLPAMAAKARKLNSPNTRAYRLHWIELMDMTHVPTPRVKGIRGNDQHRKLVLDAVMSGPCVTKDVADRVGVSYSTALNWLHYWHAQGRINRRETFTVGKSKLVLYEPLSQQTEEKEEGETK